MSIFDLLFIAIALTTIAAVVSILLFFATGHRNTAVTTSRYLLVGWGIYTMIVAGTSLFLPQRVLAVKEPRCFDDWCIAILNATPPAQDQLPVTVEISSRAKRVVQREKGIRLYLTDEGGTLRGAAQCALDEQLSPGESREMTCLFPYSGVLHRPSVVIKHDDGFPIAWFIIGEEAWFRKPTIVRLS